MGIPKRDVEERFWSHVDRRDEKSCWLWKGSCLEPDIPRFRVSKVPHKMAVAYRFAWNILRPTEPLRKFLLQRTCSNRLCVNPFHYERRTSEARKADGIKWREDLRKRRWEFKKHLVCERCSFSHPAAMVLHHRDPSTKLSDPCRLFRRKKIAKFLKEFKKCEILCANCHFIAHSEDPINQFGIDLPLEPNPEKFLRENFQIDT